MEGGQLPRSTFVLTLILVPLAIWATLTGLLVESTYAPIKEAYRVQMKGQDLVTLAFALPVLFGTLIQAFNGSRRALLLLLGVLGYVAYTYVSYTILVPMGPWFLLHVAIFGLALWAFIGGLGAVEPEVMKRQLEAGAPVKLVAGIVLAISGAITLLWLVQLVGAIVAPEAFTPEQLQSNRDLRIIFVLDLAIEMPLGALGGVLLWNRRPWGVVLATVFLVKAVTMLLALLAMSVFLMGAGLEASPWLTGFWGVLFFAALAVLVLHLRALNERPEED